MRSSSCPPPVHLAALLSFGEDVPTRRACLGRQSDLEDASSPSPLWEHKPGQKVVLRTGDTHLFLQNIGCVFIYRIYIIFAEYSANIYIYSIYIIHIMYIIYTKYIYQIYINIYIKYILKYM